MSLSDSGRPVSISRGDIEPSGSLRRNLDSIGSSGEDNDDNDSIGRQTEGEEMIAALTRVRPRQTVTSRGPTLDTDVSPAGLTKGQAKLLG